MKRVLFLLSQQPVILAGFYDFFDIPDGIYFNSLLVIHDGLFIQDKIYTVDAVGSSQIFFPTQNLERDY